MIWFVCVSVVIFLKKTKKTKYKTLNQKKTLPNKKKKKKEKKKKKKNTKKNKKKK